MGPVNVLPAAAFSTLHGPKLFSNLVNCVPGLDTAADKI
jgi:hypothetical protein